MGLERRWVFTKGVLGRKSAFNKNVVRHTGLLLKVFGKMFVTVLGNRVTKKKSHARVGGFSN
jgi:hypothetical protein